MRRAIVASENDGGPDERLLWHGTAKTQLVVSKGLDPRVCSLKGMWGGGVYFADKSTKSARYCGTASKVGDSGQLLLCRVALGRQLAKTVPERDLRRPPQPFWLFPSEAVDWLRGNQYHAIFAPASMLLLMNEYIVFHTNQGYPEYIVDFKLVK